MSIFTKKTHERVSSLPRILLMILSAGALGITLLVLPFSRPEKGVSVQTAASPSPSATPLAVTSAIEIVLPGTPVPEPAATAPAYPEGAMDLVADGAVLCTLPSGEAALSVLEEYLSYWTSLPLEENEYLVSAMIDAEVSVTAPSGKGTLLSEKDALQYLEQNPSLLPVSRTLRSLHVEETVLNDQETVSDLLPAGVTVIRRLERPSYMLFYTDREYSGSTLISKTVADGFLIGNAATGRITETGAEAAPLPEEDPSSEPAATPAPGSYAGRWGITLGFPVKGTVIKGYGTDEEGRLHYGIDILTETGYAVYAPEEGIVVYCGPRGALGNVIEIKHEDTGFISRLIGLDSAVTVELYQRVKKGDRLGQAAEAPGKTRPVFRYELLQDGIPVDPLPYIK